MSHWAKVDQDNKVIQVVVGDNNEPDEGYQWLVDNLGGTWIKTSYNGKIRKNYAAIGFIYDSVRDAFIAPKPFNSWTLNEDTCRWQAPTPYPSGDGIYQWNEELLNWEEISE